MHAELFQTLGGADGISALIQDLYDRVWRDPELVGFFQAVDRTRLQAMQTEFFAAMSGGDVHYSGAELAQIHAGRGITRHHFSRFSDHLLQAMEARGHSASTVQQVLARLATYSDKIIGSANVDG
jgi:hemoglobin